MTDRQDRHGRAAGTAERCRAAAPRADMRKRHMRANTIAAGTAYEHEHEHEHGYE
ncbi:hypothetical protein AB0C51_05480 [Streptomyces pathocidini]|uniref:hypothetical protein n=1 Tax=Streptomyces pathocidini TaxID=1650571 RepID=UPI0033EDA6A3